MRAWVLCVLMKASLTLCVSLDAAIFGRHDVAMFIRECLMTSLLIPGLVLTRVSHKWTWIFIRHLPLGRPEDTNQDLFGKSLFAGLFSATRWPTRSLNAYVYSDCNPDRHPVGLGRERFWIPNRPSPSLWISYTVDLSTLKVFLCSHSRARNYFVSREPK